MLWLKLFEPDFKTEVLYRVRAQEGDTKLTLLLNIYQEALSIPEALDKDSDEARIARRFLTEQSTADAQSKKLALKPKKEIPSGSF